MTRPVPVPAGIDTSREMLRRSATVRPGCGLAVELAEVRDRRRVSRAKQTTREWRDRVDLVPQDVTLREASGADYRYFGIDTTDLDVAETVRQIKAGIPEIYAR